MTALDTIRGFHKELTAIRRDIHAHPEIGFEETRTSELVAAELAARGSEVQRKVGRTGGVGGLGGGNGEGAMGGRAGKPGWATWARVSTWLPICWRANALAKAMRLCSWRRWMWQGCSKRWPRPPSPRQDLPSPWDWR